MTNDDARPVPRGRRDGQPTRHATVSGSGANEPKHNERKETAGWLTRQGGDRTRGADRGRERDTSDAR
jgi:hypothetical protein